MAKNITRAVVAKTSTALGQKSTLATVYTELRGKPHFHFCTDRNCRLIYEDNCVTPERNGRCQACRGVRRNNISVRDPQECCMGMCVQVKDPDELKRYSLAGPGPWFQCKICRRSTGWPCTD